MTRLKHKIICGDCMEAMMEFESKSIDMILCDLPYGTTACNWDTVIPFKSLWVQYKRIIKDNGVIVLMSTQPFATMAISSNLEMFKYEWVWCKNTSTGFQHAKNMPLRKHENVLVFSKGAMGHKSLCKNRMFYNPQGIKRVDRVSKKTKNQWGNTCGERPSHKEEYITEFKNYPTSLLYFDNENGLHQTQKPLALFEYLVKTYTSEGDLILDNCVGSGTTLVAAERLNRNSIGIEISKKYCEDSYQRLLNEIGQLRMDKEPSVIERVGF